mgnify:CR=1 FL=1
MISCDITCKVLFEDILNKRIYELHPILIPELHTKWNKFIKLV